MQLEKLGANRDVFLSLGDGGCARPAGATGWYSFVAAPDPGCVPQLLPTKCYSRIEASAPLTGKSGDLSGVLGRNQTWQYAPLIDEPGGDEHTGEMLTLAYRPPSKWPYSDPGSRRVLHFLATYNQGATDLRALGDSACYKPGPLRDVRSSYCNIEIKGGGWAGIHTNLGDSKIDQGGKGTSGVCAAYPGEDVVAVDETQYARICDQISNEAFQLSFVQDHMVETRTEIGGKDQAFTAYLTVKSLSDEVQRSVQAGGIAPWRAVSAEGLELAAQSVELVSLFLPPPTQEAGELFGAVFSLAGEVTSLIEGDEQGESAVAERIKLEPNQLTQLPTEMEQRVSAAGASFGHGLGLAGIRSREAQRRVRELRARSV